MKNNWISIRLQDVCEQITDGKHGDCRNEANSGFYFLSCKDIINGTLNYDDARQITRSDFLDTHRRTKFAPSDVVVTNSGTIGRMALAPNNHLTHRTTFQKSVAILKPITNCIVPRFLYYALQSDKRRLIEFAGGTAQKNLLLRDLRSFEISVPPLSMQHRIASILGAYDDLIELNRRRIELLEEMARRLFEEWFVHFRFPGYEDTAIIETPEGPLPEGWSMCPFSSIAIKTGESNSPKLTPDTDFYHFSFPAFDAGQLPVQERGDAILSNKIAFSDPCILVGKLNPRISRIWYVPEAGVLPQIASTEFIPLKPVEAMPLSVLYAFATSNRVSGKLRSQSQGTSTSHQRVRPNDVLSISVPIPPQSMVQQAGARLSPLYELALRLRQANARLASTRDLLLPRLLSGELSLSSAECELEAVA